MSRKLNTNCDIIRCANITMQSHELKIIDAMIITKTILHARDYSENKNCSKKPNDHMLDAIALITTLAMVLPLKNANGNAFVQYIKYNQSTDGNYSFGSENHHEVICDTNNNIIKLTVNTFGAYFANLCSIKNITLFRYILNDKWIINEIISNGHIQQKIIKMKTSRVPHSCSDTSFGICCYIYYQKTPLFNILIYVVLNQYSEKKLFVRSN